MSEAYLYGMSFERAKLDQSVFKNQSLDYVSFKEASLKHCIFKNVTTIGADFRGACLRFAATHHTTIAGAVGILSVAPIGSRGDQIIAVQHKTCVMIKGGYFWGTLDNWLACELDTLTDDAHKQVCRALYEFILFYKNAYWSKYENTK